MSKAERLLSYSLLSLITSKPMASSSPGTTIEEEDPNGSPIEKAQDKKKGLVNKDGAWCWREDCSGRRSLISSLYKRINFFSECLKLTKAVQKTCETLQTVANLYDGHVRELSKISFRPCSERRCIGPTNPVGHTRII